MTRGGAEPPCPRIARSRWRRGPTSYCTPSIIFRNSAGRRTGGQGAPQDAEALRQVRSVRGRVRPGQGSGHAEEVPWRSVINCTKPGGGPYPPPQELGQATPSPAHKAILCGCRLQGCPAPDAPRGLQSRLPTLSAPHSLASLTVEVNAAIVVLVPVFHQRFNLLVRHVLPRGPEDLSQLLCINVAICVPLGRRDREGLRDSRGSLSRPHSAPPPAPSP